MLAGPKTGHFRPKRAAPGRNRDIADSWRGLYGSDLFSSMSGVAAVSRSLKRRNWGEYICFRGVFRGETAACPDHRNIRTLAIGNLTGRGPKRILGISVRVRTNAGLVSGGAPHTEISRRIFVSATDDQPTLPAPRPSGPRRLGLSGKLLLLTIPLVMIALLMIYVPSIANFWINRLNDRLAAANTAALVLDAAPLGHGAGFAGAADPDQHRRARGRHQDGAAAPAARQRRSAGRRSTTTSTCGP